METTVRLHLEQIVFKSSILLEFAFAYIMLFLLTLLLVAFLMQFSAWGILRTLRQYFRIKFAEAAGGLDARLIKPVILRLRCLRCVRQHFGALLCLNWEEHCPPIVVLHFPTRLRRGVRKGQPKDLKIDLSCFRRYDWVLLNE